MTTEGAYHVTEPWTAMKRPVIYRQLAQTLQATITAGELAPGQKLPGEVELAQQHQVSRTTARLAIKELEKNSLVYRRRGSGTFVCAAAGPAPIVRSVFSDFVESLPGQLSREVLNCQWSEASPELATALTIPCGAAILAFRRRDRVNGIPMAYDDGWIFGAYAHRLGKDDLSVPAFYEHWQRRQGLILVRSSLELWAAPANREQAQLLAVTEGSPVLLERSDIFCRDGGAARFLTCYRHDMYRFKRVFFHVPQKNQELRKKP